jgi:hypothetical protein
MDAGLLPGRLAVAVVLTAVAVFACTAIQARPVADVGTTPFVGAATTSAAGPARGAKAASRRRQDVKRLDSSMNEL